MPKPINKTVGQCPCRKKGCELLADVRRQKDHEQGAQYLVCPTHGIDRAWSVPAQTELDAWIAQHMGDDQGQEGPAPDLETGQGQGQEGQEPQKPATARGGQEPGQERAGEKSWINSIL